MASQSSLASGGTVVRKGSRADPSTNGKLGEAWEDDRQIRIRLRDNEGKLVKWAKPELMNKGTMGNIALNSRALKHLAAWWCPQVKSAKSPSVLDDIGVNPFFDELFRHWNVRLRPGVSVIQIEVDDSDDEPSDFTDFMVVKDDPYEPFDAKDGEPAKTKMEPSMAATGTPCTKTKMETPMETPLAMAAPVESNDGNSGEVPVVTIDEVSPAKEHSTETMEKTKVKVQELVPSHDAEDVDERIKRLRLELARRAAKTFAADTAETQPLSSPMSSAVAAVLSKPGEAMHVPDDSQPTFEPTFEAVKRSLQKDFVGESFGDQHCLEMPNNQLGEHQEMPDNQLGEYPDPMEYPMPDNQLGEYPEEYPDPMLCDAPSQDEKQAPEQVVVTSVPDDEQVVTSVFDDPGPEQLALTPRDYEADGATMHSKTSEGSDSEEKPAMAEPSDMPAKGVEDEPSASVPMDGAVDHTDDEAPGRDLEEMLEAGEGLDDEEPPLVTRRSQWGLKPAPKRRGRRPATPQAAAPKPRPKAAPTTRRGGSKRTAHYMTIDDIVPPTSAAWKADPAPSAGKPVKPKAKSRAAKRKAAPKKKIQPPSVETGTVEVDDPAKTEEDEKNKVVWLPVSKESAPMVALIFTPKPAPVQDQCPAEEDHVSMADPAEQPADSDGAAAAEPEVKKAKVNNGPSFARRPCPKTSPSSERWKAVRHVYIKCITDHAVQMGFGAHSYEADWWSWCAEAFNENGQLQSLDRSDSPEACYAMFLAAAKEQLQPFLLDVGLIFPDEDDED
eukprot:s51_g21.t1